jgi:uncharacterized protein (TIGR02118 family)
MFKAMILLTRREDMTHQEFLDWWINDHAPLAATLPGLRKLTFNAVATGFDEAEIDGIAELWFDSQSDFESAYTTEIGKATAADSIAHVKGRVRLLVNENEIMN